MKVAWRDDITELERRRLEAQMLPKVPYRERVDEALASRRGDGHCPRPHLGCGQRPPRHERSIVPELVEQLGIMRFGHRPRVADTFCGSGQIPFEAARLGCDVYASDLNPVACMLTWGAFNIVGGSAESREMLVQGQQELVQPGAGERSTGWASKPMATAGEPKYFFTVSKLVARSLVGWFRCCLLGC